MVWISSHEKCHTALQSSLQITIRMVYDQTFYGGEGGGWEGEYQ